jgi:hypothetical protein
MYAQMSQLFYHLLLSYQQPKAFFGTSTGSDPAKCSADPRDLKTLKIDTSANQIKSLATVELLRYPHTVQPRSSCFEAFSSQHTAMVMYPSYSPDPLLGSSPVFF